MKIRKVINATMAILAGGMVVLSGIMKLAGSNEVVTKLSAVGVGPYIPALGIMEIVFAVLFLVPKTSRLGFVLISCYFAGAIATDLSHGLSIANATIPLALTWIATLLRDGRMFMPQASAQVCKA